MQLRRRHRRHAAAALRHVPRRVPRPCPCTTSVMKSTTDHLSAVSMQQRAATQVETHCSCTRHKARTKARASSMPVHNRCNEINNRSFICSHACSRGTRQHRRHTAVAQARTKARASSMPVHNRCNAIKNRSFISSHACSRGGDTEDTLLLHKARTKARASSMPVHNRCNAIKNRSFI